MLGFRDEEFDPKSYRAEMAGQQLAGPGAGLVRVRGLVRAVMESAPL